MGSLSINAGSPRDENYHTERLSYQDWWKKSYKNGILTSEGLAARTWAGMDAEVYHGRHIPNFHKRKNKGELLPMTNYRRMDHTLSATGKFDLVSSVDGGGNVYSNVATPHGAVTTSITPVPRLWRGNPPFDSSFFTQLDKDLEALGVNRAYYVQSAAAKLYSRGWDVGTFLAELHKTFGLLLSSARRLVNVYTDWQKYLGSLGAKAGYFIEPTAEWLQARYGWRLLVYDIEEAAETFLNWDMEQRTRNKERVGEAFSLTEDFSYNQTAGLFIADYSDIRKVEISVRGSIIADFLPARLSLNPFITTWEVVPFSFVLDWIINVGQALAALSFLSFDSNYTAAVGIESDVTRTGRLTFTPLNGAVFNAYQTVDQSYKILMRTPSYVSYQPYLRVNIDGFKIADLVAILATVLSKRGFGGIRT